MEREIRAKPRKQVLIFCWSSYEPPFLGLAARGGQKFGALSKDGSPKLPTYEPNRTGSQLVDTTINPARKFLNDKDFLLLRYSVDGANLAYIAKVTGLSRTAIKDRIREMGAERPEGIPILRGQVPYGWRVVNGQLVVHKGEQNIISKLVELRGAGMSYGKIANWLNENEISTKNGTKWDRPTVYKILRRTKHTPSRDKQ